MDEAPVVHQPLYLVLHSYWFDMWWTLAHIPQDFCVYCNIFWGTEDKVNNTVCSASLSWNWGNIDILNTFVSLHCRRQLDCPPLTYVLSVPQNSLKTTDLGTWNWFVYMVAKETMYFCISHPKPAVREIHRFSPAFSNRLKALLISYPVLCLCTSVCVHACMCIWKLWAAAKCDKGK